jgi:lipopolysaccharide export system permease protein
MAGQSEFIAILAGGVRYDRMLRPYLVGSIFLSLLFWVASQYWVPKANEIRTNFQATYVDRNSSYNGDPFRNNNYYLRVDSITYVGIKYYDTSRKMAGNFFMCKVSNHKVFYNLRSESIRWDDIKKNWKVFNAIERTMNGLQETIRKIPDTSLNLNVKPGELRRDDYMKDKLSTPELKEFVSLEEIRGTEGLNNYKVELYHRDASPFSVIIMTLIGAIISTRKIRGGSGLHLAIGLVLASTFVVMDKFSVTFSIKGNFPPILAAWIPNIIFSALALLLYRLTPK